MDLEAYIWIDKHIKKKKKKKKNTENAYILAAILKNTYLHNPMLKRFWFGRSKARPQQLLFYKYLTWLDFRAIAEKNYYS